MLRNQPHTAIQTGALARIARMIVAALTIFAGVLTVGTGIASADAPHAVGLTNISTNGFTHPWQGGWVTNVGTAWCINSGSWDPRASGNVAIDDVPAGRGVSATDRDALAYALWAHSATTDPTTPAGLSTVIHGLSGDAYASTDVPSMSVSDPAVYNSAVSIYNEAVSHAAWAAGAWNVTVTLTYKGGSGWTSTIKVTASNGQPIVGKTIAVVPHNVAASQSPGVSRGGITDANGEVHSSWSQNDPASAITVDAATNAHAYYSVWKGPDYAGGPAAQQVVTGNGTNYSGRGQATIPSGFAMVQKATTNADYQSAVGATFQVQPAGGGNPISTLTVGADGNTNQVAIPAGSYELVETSAPAGVKVDPTPHPFAVTANQLVTIPLTDAVENKAELDLVKLDAVTHEPVAGATLTVARDSNNDGTYDTTVGTFTTATTPMKVAGLTAGNYRVTETAPPPGYLPPVNPVQDVTFTWDQTATVTFSDHLTPAITTSAQLFGTDGQPSTSGSVPAGLAGMSNVVGPVGTSLHDLATVTGLAAGEKATITSELFGPVQPGEPLVCDAAHRVWSGTWSITGSGNSTSGAFTPIRAGLYGYVETLTVPGVGSYTGKCGQITETLIFTPTITTKAQTPSVTPGATVADIATVTGLSTGTVATVDTSLYGPFTNQAALDQACENNFLGAPVGHVTYKITGSGTTTSPSITLGSSSAAAGVYTFIETLKVPGWPGTFTHTCGTPPETFTVPYPPAPRVTSGSGAAASTSGVAALPVTGAAAGLLAAGGAALVATGAIVIAIDRRRRTASR